MSPTVEWFALAHPFASFDLAHHGGRVPEDSGHEVTDEVALVVGGDAVAVIEGTRARLRACLLTALAELGDDTSTIPAADSVSSPTPVEHAVLSALGGGTSVAVVAAYRAGRHAQPGRVEIVTRRDPATDLTVLVDGVATAAEVTVVDPG